MMEKIMKTILSALMLVLIGAGCVTNRLRSQAQVVVENGRSEYVIAYGTQNGIFDKFAAEEFQKILQRTTAVNLKLVAADSPEAMAAAKRIIIGKSKLATGILGVTLVNSLRDQESLVIGVGHDIILIGGGDLGTQYAVFDFLEKEAAYRCFAPYPGGERIVKTERLIYSGKQSRNIPAFTGYRTSYGISWNLPGMGKFLYRNRNNELFKLGKNSYFADPDYHSEFYRVFGSQHGLTMFVPPHDSKFSSLTGMKFEGLFDKHPEYFSLSADGTRSDKAQLCFSNPELRKVFTERFLQVVKKKGDGVYMVGSNDHHNQKYCNCPGCLALAEKYNTNGGALWDYLVELCTLLEKDYPHVYVTSLAYKGPKQTEKAPDGIIFPDNFICDAAFLNSDCSLKEVADLKLEDGTTFNRFENLKKWTRICKHVSYWYYGGQTPCLVSQRAQKELKELRDAGVKSVGSCGVGGGMEFGDIAMYVYYRLLLNPDADADALVTDACAFKYGAAAAMMVDYIAELERSRQETFGRYPHLWADDSYNKMGFVTAEQIVRWQKDFDTMLQLVKDDPVRSRNVRIARVGVDIWSVIFQAKIRKAFPELKIDVQTSLSRGLAACTEAEQAKMVLKNKNSARRILNSMSIYAYLKDDAIPVELQKNPRNKVFRYLPVQPPHFFKKTRSLTPDKEAVAQFTMKADVSAKSLQRGVKFEFYDALAKKWVFNGTIEKERIVPGQYKLYCLGTAYLPAASRFVLGGRWGSALDMNGFGRYYDPSYQQKQFEYWVSLKCEGPALDPQSTEKTNSISCDQVFLIDKGMPGE
jgi:hypothetical protein